MNGKWRIILLALLMSLVCKVDAQSYLIEGKYLPEPCMQTGTDKPKFGYAIYREVEGEGKQFELVIGYQYEEAHPFVEPVGLARVKIDGKYGFIGTNNALVISARFEEADNFTKKEVCRVMEDGKYGLIDDGGFFIVPNKYDAMNDLLNGWYEVAEGDVWGYVYRTGIYVSSREEYQKKCEAGFVD